MSSSSGPGGKCACQTGSTGHVGAVGCVVCMNAGEEGPSPLQYSPAFMPGGGSCSSSLYCAWIALHPHGHSMQVALVWQRCMQTETGPAGRPATSIPHATHLTAAGVLIDRFYEQEPGGCWRLRLLTACSTRARATPVCVSSGTAVPGKFQVAGVVESKWLQL